MDVYVARQPIFDRSMKVYGYELLYRKSMNNYYEGEDDNRSTAELINNSFFALRFQELTQGKRAFINFSEEMLFRDIPFLLPKDLITVEILERVKSSEELLQTCKKLKKHSYMTALDDFVFQDSFVPIIDEIDLIKIEFPTTALETQTKLIHDYHKSVKFLAEKVETREEYQRAMAMGYDYFQGYFFSKPVILKGKDLPNINGNLVRIISELKQENPNFQKITEIMEIDVGLSYKLLRVANSVFFGTRNKIFSIKNALVRLGIEEIRKWIYLMMLKDIQGMDNRELIKTSLIRAKMMEQISVERGNGQMRLEYFMTGLFSSIDVLLNRKMESVVDELALTEEVKSALLGVDNEIRKVLLFVEDFENANWNGFEAMQKYMGIDREHFMEMYLDTLKWVVNLDYD